MEGCWSANEPLSERALAANKCWEGISLKSASSSSLKSCPQIIFIMGCTQIFIIPVIIFILENIQIVIVTNHHNVDVDANQLGHRAEKRGQEASLSSKARQGRPGSQARQGRPGQKKLRKKRRGDDKLVRPGH